MYKKINVKGRVVRVAKVKNGFAVQVRRGKREWTESGYTRPWTARRGGARAVIRKEV